MRSEGTEGAEGESDDSTGEGVAEQTGTNAATKAAEARAEAAQQRANVSYEPLVVTAGELLQMERDDLGKPM